MNGYRALFLTIVLCAACSEKAPQNPADANLDQALAVNSESEPATYATQHSEERQPCRSQSPHRQALFGDLHVHTSLSFDAVAGRIDIRPADAHDFAQGKTIPYFPQDEQGTPSGAKTIDRPLDFLAVSDHSEYLGERALCSEPNSSMYDKEFCSKYREIEFRGTLMMASMVSQPSPKRIVSLCGDDGQRCVDYSKTPWQEIIAAADAAYDRSSECAFTSFIAYEYTGTPRDSNYHRNVIFRNSAVPELPVSYVEAPKDYQLWEQLDLSCSESIGCDYITIPHNSNLSNGLLLTPYADLDPSDKNKIAYAKRRLDREPIVEIFQHKGSSECINGLSSVYGKADELCDIEQVRHFGEQSTARSFELQGTELVFTEPETQTTVECGDGELGKRGMFAGGCVSRNDFLRSALLTGLEEQSAIGFNPVKLGVIASTDGHTGTPGAVVENQWSGTVSGEMDAVSRLKPGTLPSGIKGNPGGLAGVWAIENSRDAIFNALERKETFGTSGPRISPRFFAGWNYPADLCESTEMVASGYSGGVPMGGDLQMSNRQGKQSKPMFILAANKDTVSGATDLQQLQLIKGWVDANGKRHTEVRTVAGSATNNAGVDTNTGVQYGSGHDRLCAVISDEQFDPTQPAYYYMRVVENPSARWSLKDCLSIAENQRPKVCANLADHTIQEMAWSSPIWYTPQADNF